MDLRVLRYFLTVAKEQSFTKAAKQLHIMFLEPVNTEGFEYIRVKESDHWVLTMRADDPLAELALVYCG